MTPLGLQLFVSWLNLMLYSSELAMAVLYLDKFPRDARFIRFLVSFLVLADTVGTMCTCASTWLFAVTFANTPVMYNLWTIPVLILATTVSATLEQSFLIYRLFALSRSKLICGFLMLLVATHVSFSFLSSIEVALHPEFKPGLGTTATTISYCIGAAVDITIPILLIWHLRKFTSPFEHTRNLVRRTSVFAISSGSLVALACIAFLILFWGRHPAFLIVMNILGRLYSLTVFANLMARKPRETRDNTPRTGNTDTHRDFRMSGLFSLDLTTPSRMESVVLDESDPSSRNTGGNTSDPSDRFKGQASLTEPL